MTSLQHENLQPNSSQRFKMALSKAANSPNLAMTRQIRPRLVIVVVRIVVSTVIWFALVGAAHWVWNSSERTDLLESAPDTLLDRGEWRSVSLGNR